MRDYANEITFVQVFEIEKALKISERGFVYLVRNKNTRQRYIYRSFSGSSSVYKRMCGLDCPYLPRIYDVHEENGKVQVLEEYVQGDTLAFLLEGKCLTTDQAKQITLQLCHALYALHGIGAVHRDIKPENVIIRGSDAVLIDFDASRLCKAENTTDTQIMGTTGYAAPEQYGFSQTDARTDIYSMGILLNEMLTKSHPSRKLAEGMFRPVVEKCIQVNADQRYASVEELMKAIKESRSWRLFPTRKQISWLIAGIMLICVGFILSWLLQGNSISLGSTQLEISDPDSVSIFSRERVSVAEGIWNESTEGFATPFQSDFDGDGEPEKYLFGVDFVDSPQENVVFYDNNTCELGFPVVREVHPCIWRINKNGTVESAPELAHYLSKVQTNIWRTDPSQSTTLEAWTTEQIWPGSVQITFFDKDTGTWLYSISAFLGDKQLTAQATTSLRFA